MKTSNIEHPTSNIQWLRRLLIISAFQLFSFSAFATLTALVNPGYVLSPGEVPTTDILNQLGQPTVTISGTVSGSTGLTPGSVDGSLLSTTLPDGVTLDWNSSVPRQLEIMAAGVHTNNLDTNDWEFPLYQTNGSSQVKIITAANLVASTNGLDLNTNVAVINSLLNPPTNAPTLFGSTNAGTTGSNTNLYLSPQFVISNGVFYLVQFQSTDYALPGGSGGLVADVAHGFTNTPTQVRWVLVCQTADASGYNPGDQVPVQDFSKSGGDPSFSSQANSTNVSLSFFNSGFYTVSKTNGSLGQIALTPGSWEARCYARP